MQQDVLSIFIYFNDRIAPAEVRIQMGKARQASRPVLAQGNLNFPSLYLPRRRKRKPYTVSV